VNWSVKIHATSPLRFPKFQGRATADPRFLWRDVASLCLQFPRCLLKFEASRFFMISEPFETSETHIVTSQDTGILFHFVISHIKSCRLCQFGWGQNPEPLLHTRPCNTLTFSAISMYCWITFFHQIQNTHYLLTYLLHGAESFWRN